MEHTHTKEKGQRTRHTLTRESGRGPGGGPWHIALLGCGDDQQCPKAVREAQVGIALGCRCFHSDRGVVAKELYGGPSQGPPGAGIAQVNFQRHLWGQKHKTNQIIDQCVFVVVRIVFVKSDDTMCARC